MAPDLRSFDLHSHSRYSDGRCNPMDLARMAWASGLTGLAVTDHDTVAHYPAAEEACATFGLHWVPGIEVSTEVAPSPRSPTPGGHPHEVHLLALWVSPDGPLAAELDRLQQARRRRALAMVDVINAAGADIDPTPILTAPAEVSIGRPHVARMLVDAGVVATPGQAFAEWLGEGRPAHIPKGALHPVRTIELIRASGGAAILAHPTWGGVDRPLLDAMTTAGLAGIESPRDASGPEVVALWRSAARDRGLVVTEGSDFHGEAQSTAMGCHSTPAPMVEALRARAEGEVSTW